MGQGKRKPIKVPLYLGRITNAGQFIPAKKRKPRDLIQQQTAETVQNPLEEGQTQLTEIVKEEKKYRNEPAILRALSMNGRISMSVLGHITSLKETTVSSQVKKIEKKYNIKYLAEIDATKLGYIRFLITVKFLDNLPSADELKGILAKEPRVQLAFMTKGEVDLMLYALAKDSEEITFLVLGLRTKVDYNAVWNAAPVFEDYGCIPIREEFIDLLKGELLNREYAVLKELSKDGKIDFTEIDKRHRFDRGRSQYSYYKMKEREIIKRITISMPNLAYKYIAVIFEDIVNWNHYRTKRAKSLKNIISENRTQVNRYLLVEDTVSPNGIVLYLPVFNNGDLESTISERAELDLGITSRSLIITSILLGSFCFRNFDNSYSVQQEVLISQYKENVVPQIDYEETGRIRKERKKYSGDIRGLNPEIV